MILMDEKTIKTTSAPILNARLCDKYLFGSDFQENLSFTQIFSSPLMLVHFNGWTHWFAAR